MMTAELRIVIGVDIRNVVNLYFSDCGGIPLAKFSQLGGAITIGTLGR